MNYGLRFRRLSLCLLLCALILPSAWAQEETPDYTKWSIHGGKFYDNGKWVFLKAAKPLINYADADNVSDLIKKLDILKEKHYNVIEMNCYWHHFDTNGDGIIDKSLAPLRNLINVIYNRGMYPCLSVETYSVGGGNIPDGFWKRCPDAYAIDSKGNQVSDTEYGFGTRVVSIYHTGYRDAVHRYIRSLARSVDTKKILYFETTVEPQYMGNTAICYSENARTEYNKWREENGIADAASAMPEGFPMPQNFVRNETWNKFRAQFLARWVNEDAEAYRSVAGENARVAVDYLDANESVQYLRDGNPIEFLRALTCADIIQINWTWNLETKSLNHKAYDRVWQVKNETGRDWAVAEHMTFNGNDFTNLTDEKRRLILENTLQRGTRLGWEFTNVNNSTADGFSLYYDDFSPKATIATVDNNWDYWMTRVTYWENQLSPVEAPQAEKAASQSIYSINGTVVRSLPLTPGLYVINGRKTLVH
ncbi:MAG: hypothetical protein K5945_07825 [Bacteroidaceae bacterium]|nr:hypothetical protein [Bacteroidaceae bacterium]